jgi:hypothetical protein
MVEFLKKILSNDFELINIEGGIASNAIPNQGVLTF